MENQKIKNNLDKILLIPSIVLCLLSLIPLNLELIIVGIILSVVLIVLTILFRKNLKNNYYVLILVVTGVALATDVSFLCYVLFMI